MGDRLRHGTWHGTNTTLPPGRALAFGRQPKQNQAGTLRPENSVNALQQTCQRAAEEPIEEAGVEAQAQINKSAGNSRGYLMAQRELRLGWKAACKAAANRLAEIKGADAPSFASDLRAALEGAKPMVLGPMQRITGKHHAFGKQNESLLVELAESVETEIQATLDDLSQNLADGRHVDRSKSRLMLIDNRNGNGQFLIDSPGASQAVGRDMTNAGSTISEIASLLEQLRSAIPGLSLPSEMATEFEDLVVTAEREAASENVVPSRLKRFIGRLQAFSEQAGASATGTIVAQLVLLASGLA